MFLVFAETQARIRAKAQRFAIIFSIMLSASVSQAQTPNECLTAQLETLGYGVEDSTWRSLKSGVNAFLQSDARAGSLDLPEFTAQSTLTWCRVLGQRIDGLHEHWPSNQEPLVIADSDLQVDRAALIAAQDRVRRFVERSFGVALAGRFAVVASHSDRGLTRMVNRGLRTQGKRSGRINTDVSRFCNPRRVGGFAGRHFIALCWPQSDRAEPRYDQLLRTGLLPVFAHEFMHQVQYELAMDIPARRLSDGSDFLLGPAWMVEGAAEYLELQFVTGPIAFEGTALFNLQSAARRTRSPLSELRQSGSVAGGRAYGTARFAAVLLAKKHGGKALFEYFEALGRLQNREQAFETVFKQSMDEFEREFETLRRDFGAAEAYE